MRTLSHSRRPHESERPAERGVVLVVMAISLVAVLTLATVVVSGSMAYPQRRNAQNAADAAATAAASALDDALFFGGSAGNVAATVADLTDDHKAQRHECWLIHNDGTRMVTDLGDDVPCDDTGTITSWRNFLAANPPTTDQPTGVEVVVFDEKPTLFGGLQERNDTVTARASAKATIQTVTRVGSPWVICANPAYAGERGGLDDPIDLLTTVPDGPDADDLPDFVFNPDGTIDIDPVKAAAANSLNGGKGIGLDGSKVAECGAGAEFDGKGERDQKFPIPGYGRVQGGTGYESMIQDQVVSANPCPTPLPEVLSGCELLLPITIYGSNLDVYLVAAGVFSITGTGHGKYGYYGKYVGRAQNVVGTHSTDAPPSASSLRVIRLTD